MGRVFVFSPRVFTLVLEQLSELAVWMATMNERMNDTLPCGRRRPRGRLFKFTFAVANVTHQCLKNSPRFLLPSLWRSSGFLSFLMSLSHSPTEKVKERARSWKKSDLERSEPGCPAFQERSGLTKRTLQCLEFLPPGVEASAPPSSCREFSGRGDCRTKQSSSLMRSKTWGWITLFKIHGMKRSDKCSSLYYCICSVYYCKNYKQCFY